MSDTGSATSSLARIAILATVALCGQPVLVHAQSQRLRDMDHRSWTPAHGAPTAINHLAQDADGSLWLGAAPPAGLYNFDGETFRPFQSPPGEPRLPSTYVTSLLVTKGGTLCAAFQKAGLARVAGGRVTLYEAVAGNPIESVRYLREAPDGVLWGLDSRLGPISFGRDGTWRKESAPTSGPISAMFIDSSNTLWLVQDGFLYRRPLSQTAYSRTDVRADVVTGLTETADGEIWMNDHPATTARGRLQQIGATGQLIRAHPEVLPESRAILPMPDGSLLVASFVAGLRRMSARDLAAARPHGESASDSFTTADGLSSQWPRALLLDAHGNLWIGTQFGLDRLRPRHLIRSLPSQPGVTWGMCSTPGGGTLIANSLGRLYSVVQGTPTRLPYGLPPAVRSFTCADVDRLWFIDRAGAIWSSVAGRAQLLPPIEGMRRREFVKLLAASDHTLYVSVILSADDAGSVWRYRDNRWTQLQHGGEPDAGGHAYVDRHARLWIGDSDGQAIRHDERESWILSSGDPGLGIVHVFRDTSHGFLAAGTNGLAVLRHSAFEMLQYADPSLVRGVRGIVESRNGDLWLNSANGFVQLTAGEIRAAIANPTDPMEVRLVRDGDFVPNRGAHTVRTTVWDSVARDAQGTCGSRS